MDKRVLIASTISMGMVAVWLVVFKPHTANVAKPEVAGVLEKAALATEPAAKPAATATPTSDGKADAKPSDGKADAKPSDGKADAKPSDGKAADADKPAAATPPAPPAKAEYKETTLEVPGYYRATFNNYGGAASHWVLLNPQYKEDNPRKSNKQAEPIDLVRTSAPNLPLGLSFVKTPTASFDLAEDAVWTEEPRGSDGSVVYSWNALTNVALGSDGKPRYGELRVERRYTPVPNSYEVRLTVTVTNKGDKPIEFYPRLTISGWHDPAVKSGGFMAKRVSQTEGLCLTDGKLKKANLEAMLKKSENAGAWGKGIDEWTKPGEPDKVRWIGVGEQYFVMAAALKLGNEGRRCEGVGYNSGLIETSLTIDKQTLAKQAQATYQWTLFMGPKILSRLDAVTVAGEDAELGKAVDYGWTEAVARPMLGVLKGIHVVVPNWGFSIILLTILLKALTWWPTQRSMKSMKAMAKLKPEMDKLKERYGDDKNGMNVAMMELYKKHGVNPLGGCLPVLIQMPIYIALYAMLGNSVELYRSGFLGWIKDLTAADPYYVLPILTGALMFLQQKTQPASPDPQQRTMMYIMPVMFTAFSIFLPSGLTIYILTNTVLTFVQQFWINRGDKPSQPSKPAMTKPARA
jgi:YidC/Oxa1 family membrane protein insertase